jgi:hypothetical protein
MHTVISAALSGPYAAEPAPRSPAIARAADPLQGSDYERSVKGHAERTIFHSAAWLRVLRDTYGFEPLAFISASGSVLPMMEVNSVVTGRRGVSLPFTDDCAPLLRATADFAKLWDAALEHGRAKRWKYVELRGGAELLPQATPSLSYYRHVLDLDASEKALSERLEPAVRRAVRKAQNAGVQVERSTDVQGVRSYYDLHCKTRKRQGLPPQPWEFFLNIERHILSQGLGSIVLAKIGQTAVAGAVFFHAEKKALFKFGASDMMWQSVRANNLVMWEGIQWHAQNGFEQLDLGRTSLENEGLRRFKRGWGTREERIHYVKYALGQEAFVKDKERTNGLHNRVFRSLPLPLLRAAGAALYRHSA